MNTTPQVVAVEWDESLERVYQDYVVAHSDSTVYHGLAWREVLRETYGYRSHYLLALRDTCPVGVLPLFVVDTMLGGRRVVSLPFSHWVGPLYDDPGVLSELLVAAKMFAQDIGAGYLEIKAPLSTEIPSFRHASSFFETRLLLTPEPDVLWRALDDGLRRGIRKAERLGVTVRRVTEKGDMDGFYGLMLSTRRRQGAPPYSRQFFRSVHDHLIDSGVASLYLVDYGGTLVAGLIMFYGKQTALYAYGASVTDKVLMNVRPNNLLFWSAIQDARMAGNRYFDFGITHPSNAGLLRFKNSWGGETRRLEYSYCLNVSRAVPVKGREGPLFQCASKVFQKLPLFITKRVGPPLLRQLG